MTAPGTGRDRGQTGLVGKMVVIWLVVAAILVVGLYDAGTILLSRVHVSDVAGRAAQAAATEYRDTHQAAAACAAAEVTVQDADPQLRHPKKGWCTIDTGSGEATVTLRRRPKTLLAQRLPVTRKFADRTVTETAGPAAL